MWTNFKIDYQEDDKLASLDVTNDVFVMYGNYSMFQVRSLGAALSMISFLRTGDHTSCSGWTNT